LSIDNQDGIAGSVRPKPYPNRRETSGRRRESRNVRRKGGAGIAGPVIVICAVIAGLVALNYWANAGQIYRGVEVGSLELGGKTPEEARRAIEERVAGPLELTGFKENATLSAKRLGADFDVSATVDAAYAVGREGSIVERLLDRVRAARGQVEATLVADYEPQTPRAAVENLAGRVNAEPRKASVSVSGSEVRVQTAREGYELDVPATTENVERALKDISGEATLAGETREPEVSTREAERAADRAREAVAAPVLLTAEGARWTLSTAEAGQALEVTSKDGEIRVRLNRDGLRDGMADVYDALTVEPVEAGYVVDGAEVSVKEGRTGVKIEEESLFGALENGLFKGRREYEIPTAALEPELTTAEAKELKPTTLLGEYRTDYTWDTDPGRRTNMRRASDAINGTFVAPGEVFSYNAVTEPLDYEEAKVIENGAVAYEEGGGLSQVSSTLYMAANLAGLEIVEANPHYAELPYIRPGFDTTVWFGALDLRIENNTGGYVLIREWVDEDGFNYARIYGRPTGKEVKMWSEKAFDGTDPEGTPTTRWVTYKKITRNGKVLLEGVFRRDTYKELDPYELPAGEKPPD